MFQRCYGCMSQLPYPDAPCPNCGYDRRVTPFNRNHLEPGTVLQERYIIGKALGLGGFGITYIGWDCKAEQPVSIKEFLPSEFATHRTGTTRVQFYSAPGRERFEAGLQKFKEQTAILRRLQDLESINPIYDFVEENGTGYTIMEYLRGQTLKTYLAQYRMLSFEDAMSILAPVLRTLDAVHKSGLLHQDICPDNIFLCEDGRIKLLDFGSAQFQLMQNTEGLTIVLKHGYAPIEQYVSHLVAGPWTDVFGAAGTLYTMLTGIVPPDVLHREKDDDILRPSDLESDIPPEAEKALMRALELSPENRYATAEAFLKALYADADAEEMPQRKISRKSLRIALMLIAATLAVLVLVAIAVSAARRPKKEPLSQTETIVSEVSPTLPAAEHVETFFDGFAPDTVMPICTADGRQTALPYAAFTKNGRTGVVQTDGKILIPANYGSIVWDDVRGALLLDGEVYGTENTVVRSEGIAPDLSGSTYGYGSDGLTRILQNGSSFTVPDSDGTFLVHSGSGYGISTRRTLLVEPVYSKATPISCGIAAFLKGEEWTYFNSYGVDIFGRSFPKSLFPNGVPYAYSEGYVPFYDAETELWGYADTAGRTVCAPKYLAALPPMQGKAWIRTEQGYGVLALTGSTEEAPSGYCGNDALYIYHPQSGLLEITGSGALWDFTPETIPWMYAQQKICTVRISGNISYIGANTFRNCTALTSVTVSCMPESIGAFAFSGCTALCALSLPESVISVGDEAFADCRSLMDISLGGSMRRIGVSAFRDCAALKTVCFNSSALYISAYAFTGCTTLDKVQITGSEVTIGISAFDGCAALQTVTLPAKAVAIGTCAFRGCSALRSMHVPLGIKTIASRTFMDCAAMTTLTLPDGLTRIEAEAFSGCAALDGLSLPPTLTSIGERAFYNCRGLGNVMVPSSVSKIDSYAFAGCTGITMFDLDDTVQTLGSSVFSGWTASQSIRVRNAFLKRMIGQPDGWDPNWSAGSYASIVSK